MKTDGWIVYGHHLKLCIVLTLLQLRNMKLFTHYIFLKHITYDIYEKFFKRMPYNKYVIGKSFGVTPYFIIIIIFNCKLDE